MSNKIMEVIKCGLCKEEIEYAQRCRVYIETDEPRPFQRISKRPHIGRYKLISTAKSTEHISFARRLKRLREIKKHNSSPSNSSVGETARKNTSGDYKETSKVSIKDQIREKFNALKSSKNISTEEDCKKTVENIKEEITESPISAVEETTADQTPSTKKSVAIRSKPQFKDSPSAKKTSDFKMNYPHFQSSFEEYIKPILTKNNSVGKEQKVSAAKEDSNENQKDMVTSTPVKPVRNDVQITNVKNTDCETYYWLEFPKLKPPESRKLGYPFQNLVSEVKHMKLPNSNWKIKIMVHKQEMVSVSFTKKVLPEKVVSVYQKSLLCDITIDGKKAVLAASPLYIHSIKDLEIMLDIVDGVDPNSPVISYITTAP